MEDITSYLIKNFPQIGVENIEMIIEVATEDILNYCNLVEVPGGLSKTLLQMAIHKCNTMNEIGITGVQGVLTMSYEFNYPDNIIKNLRRFRKLA